MIERSERFTFNSKELQKQIVTEGVIWEGVVWELNDHCRDLVMWFNTESEGLCGLRVCLRICRATRGHQFHGLDAISQPEPSHTHSRETALA